MYRQKRHGCPAMPLPRQAIARPARDGLHSTKRVPVSRFAPHRRKARVTACPARFAQRSDEPSRNPINTPPHRTRKAGTPNNVRTGRTGGTSRRTAPRRDNGGYTLRQEAKRKRKSARRAVFQSGCSVSSGIGDGRTVKGQIWQKRIVPANDSILSKNGMTVPARKTDRNNAIKRTSRLQRPKKASEHRLSIRYKASIKAPRNYTNQYNSMNRAHRSDRYVSGRLETAP